MFTGLIQEIGILKARAGNNRLTITAPSIAKDSKEGDSISVNGVCLTIVKKEQDSFTVDLLTETIKKTNLGKIRIGDSVNLESALKVGDKLGGHIVTGHTDCTGKLVRKYRKTNDTVIEIELPITIAKKLITKGSVSINGVSLTIVNITRNRFTTHLIPYTLEHTNLGNCKIGNLLNIELDKYLQR